MYKELIISIVVITLVIVGNLITQNNTTKSVEQVSTNLIVLRDEILKQNVNQQNCKQKMENVEKIWEERYETMAYYIEHDELEKVNSELTKLKANIDTQDYSQGVENLDNCCFILEHINDKSALKIVNIF